MKSHLTVKSNLTTSGMVYLLLLTMLAGCLPNSANTVGQIQASGLLEDIDYVRITFVSQTDNYDCGLACLVSVLDYCKIPVNHESLLEEMPPGSMRTGYSVGELREIAKSKNINAFALIGNPAFLEQQLQQGRPVIVPLDMSYNQYRYNFVQRVPLYGEFFAYIDREYAPRYSHFVTVFAVAPNTVWVMDPMYGMKPIPKTQFNTMWEAKKNAMLLVASS